ncbi:MAG TPA: 2-succinyl-5-enolpyruvyl-6-hydroxy-3-cyclohexene-1-carboxylic-acid synthase [Bacteroidetes bacterium]|nr:2-succinyl-5-enolpyruvyl-6-hydroxy-3-cyclohexene-1-carboxylic-acid synthase [Bacteroidota bacterium]
MTSDKKNVSLLADLFVKKGLSDIVISPGSRNAPVIIAFANHPGIRALSVVDERSAGYFALGMARQTGKTVAVTCTSGTAALNYAPAIAEAYYQKIPLLVLTADRPPELIEVGDGQTIRQKDVYRNYVKESFELPCVVDDPATFQIAEEMINRAIDLTLFPEPGPVHINIPLREPLYGTSDDTVEGRIISTVKKPEPIAKELIEGFAERWNVSERILIVAGQMQPDPLLNSRLAALSKLDNVVILTETTSNLHDPRFMDCIDNVVSTIGDEEAKKFQPGLVVSFGGQVVSKMIKRYLRLNPPKDHWHISASGEQRDTWFSLTGVVPLKPAEFFRLMAGSIANVESMYAKIWAVRLEKVKKIGVTYLEKIPWSDLRVFERLFSDIPGDSILHLGNSTPVRYSQLFGSSAKFIYHSNRGVSGIDGQVSTAAGAAFTSEKINTIITGDLGFLYDSNALMNHNLTPNLKIIVINNGGGGIFRFIHGPDTSPLLEKFFSAKHNWRADKIAETFDVNYFKASNEKELAKVLNNFYAKMTRPAILEIFTPSDTNARILKDYFKALKTNVLF